jgi:hypothetical protein
MNQRLTEVLKSIVNKEHAGKHFTEKYNVWDLHDLEECGVIEIDRPAYCSCPLHWTLNITDKGLESLGLPLEGEPWKF